MKVSKVNSFLALKSGLLAASLLWLGTGCSPSFEGAYSDPAKAEIVDDKWNETDAKQTADELIHAVLSKPWLQVYKAQSKRSPVVLIDDIANRTDEHIDTKALYEFIRDELINSGQVRFVDNKRRQQILDELKYQNSGAVSGKTAKKTGKQTGADFMLSGAISSTVHTQDGLKTVTYQTALLLTDLETSEIVWSGKKLIKKRFKRSGTGW